MTLVFAESRRWCVYQGKRAQRANDPNYKHFSWLFRGTFAGKGVFGGAVGAFHSSRTLGTLSLHVLRRAAPPPYRSLGPKVLFVFECVRAHAGWFSPFAVPLFFSPSGCVAFVCVLGQPLRYNKLLLYVPHLVGALEASRKCLLKDCMLELSVELEVDP